MERERIYLGEGVSIYREWLKWYVEVSQDGRRDRRSLGTGDRWEALLAVVRMRKPQMVTEALSVRKEIDLADVVEDIGPQKIDAALVGAIVKAEIAAALGKKPASEITLAAAVEKYIAAQEADGREEAYIQTARVELARFAKESGVRLLADVTPDHITAHKAALRKRTKANGKTLSEKSIYNYATLVTAFFAWAAEPKSGPLLPQDPSRGLAPELPGRKPVRFFSAEEVEKIMREVDPDPEVAAAVALGLYAGLRREEAFALEARHIDLEARWLRVYAPKTDAYREVPILDQLLPHLLKLRDRKGRILARWNDEDAFGRIAQRAIARALGSADREGFNVCRHTFATWVQANGVGSTVAAQWAGHSPAIQQKHYTGRVGRAGRALEMTWHGEDLTPAGVPDVASKIKRGVRGG